MPLVNVPTTWLAQADSAIGGKVAIDLPSAKNGVGTFWPASLIVEDCGRARDAACEQRRDGIAECLKAGLIGDSAAVAAGRGARRRGRPRPDAARGLCDHGARGAASSSRSSSATRSRPASGASSTWVTPSGMRSRSKVATRSPTARPLRWACAPWRTSRYGEARRRTWPTHRHGPCRPWFRPRAASFDRSSRILARRCGDKKRETGVQRWILPMAMGEVIEVSDVTDDEVQCRDGRDRGMRILLLNGPNLGRLGPAQTGDVRHDHAARSR